MDIYSTIFALIIATHPGIALERAHDVASTIDDVATSTQEAVVLLTIADHESSLRESVQDCSICTGPRCDHGNALGMWQIHRHFWAGHSREEVCSDPVLAARLSAEAWRKTGSWTAFSGCQADLGCKAADELRALHERYARKVAR